MSAKISTTFSNKSSTHRKISKNLVLTNSPALLSSISSRHPSSATKLRRISAGEESIALSQKQRNSKQSHISSITLSSATQTSTIVLPIQQKWDDELFTKNPVLLSPTIELPIAPSDLITPPPSPRAAPRKEELDVSSLNTEVRFLEARRSKNIKNVLSEYASLKKQGVSLSLASYNLIFESYLSLRREGTPLTPMFNVYEDMLWDSIPPNSATYSILIRALCKRDVEVQKVVAMLKRQTARSGQQERTGKNSNIGTLEAEANLAKALVLFKEAVTQGCSKDFPVDLYNQLLRVLSHYGNTKDSLIIYDELTKHTPPSSATFAALINLFGRAGDVVSADGYFQKYVSVKETLGVHDASYVYNASVDSHLKCNDLEGAIRITENMPNDGVKLSIIPYNSIIRHYCSHNEMDQAMVMVNRLTASEDLPTPDASSYGPILSAYCQVKNYDAATEAYDALVKTDISKSYGNLANYALLCLGNLEASQDKVLQVIQEMKSAGLEPDALLSERIITQFVSCDDIPRAIAALRAVVGAMTSRTLSKGSNHIVNASLQVAMAAKEHFSQVLEVVKAVSCIPSIGLSSSLASVLVTSYHTDGDHEPISGSDCQLVCEAALVTYCHGAVYPSLPAFDTFVLTLVKDMVRPGTCAPPSALVYRVSNQLKSIGANDAEVEWVSAFNNHTQVEQEVEVQDNSVPPKCGQIIMTAESEIDTANIMKAVINGSIDEAQRILKQKIIQLGLVPSPEPMRDAIALAGKQGHLEVAKDMYAVSIKAYKDQLHLEDPHRAQKAIFMATNSILIGYAQQGEMSEAKKYYDAIKEMGRYPDGNGYASLLLGSAKCATDEATDALIIYDEAKRHDVKPTTFFYNVVISKLAKARKLDLALCLFDEMRQFKVSPNSITYGALISACVRAGSETHASRLFGEMLASPYELRVGPFNNMIQFYVRQQPNRARALEYFEELRRRSVKPSAYTYKLLMEAYATIAPYDRVSSHRMLSEMESCDRIRPQATHYATLVYSYGTLERDVKSAKWVFDEMHKAGVVPDEVVYQAMLDTYITNDELERAEKLYLDMQKRIGKSSSPYIENLFIRGYGKKGMLPKAEAMFKAMTDDKIYCASLQKNANNVVVVREPSTYEAMVRAYLDNKLVNKAKVVLDSMIKREFPEKVTAVVADLIIA
ncbi:hypothetical protein CLU79DRAFT_828264 [Phycomyces nitens]|nr:hypothetical protein CLU79DRAFT_828264 [Phycomyces nitens]